MTDRAGTVVQRNGYTPFGNERYRQETKPQNPLIFDVSSRYTGQTLDEDTGLYYYGARYYDPEIARFVQADTIVPDPGFSQAYNRYAYCVNNPIKFTDPTGHVFVIDDALIFAVCSGAFMGGMGAHTNVGNIIQGMAMGAAMAAVSYGIGQAVGAGVSRALEGYMSKRDQGTLTFLLDERC